MADSQVTLVGAVGRDPELRYTAGGAGMAKFSMAVSRKWQQNGEWKEETSWFDVIAWNQLAENVCASIVKGTRVVVTGRIGVRDWEGKGGEKRRSVEVTADEVAVSLRWATADVVRNERSTGGGGAARSTAPKEHTYAEDEEPF